MSRPRKTEQVETTKKVPTIDIEKAFRQVAQRMEQIRREYGSAAAYQEEFRSKHQAKESAGKAGKRR